VSALVLRSDALRVELLPDKGCDIASIVDRRTDVEVLWQAPWGRRAAHAQPWAADSEVHWMYRLSGGWQILLPHAGTAREVDGAVRGFHGEAGLAVWAVQAATDHSATLSTQLLSAPLAVRRSVVVEGSAVVVEESVTNESPDPAAFSWGHHPTFGAPLVAPGARLEIAARAQRDEGSATSSAWPMAGTTDRSVVPEEPRAVLTYLEDLDEGCYRLVNEKIGLGVEVRWPLDVFPSVWLWQELHASPGFPWFRRAYAMGIEPHTTVPQGGPPAMSLRGGESRTARLELRVLHL
jgi:hypothetical protein